MKQISLLTRKTWFARLFIEALASCRLTICTVLIGMNNLHVTKLQGREFYNALERNHSISRNGKILLRVKSTYLLLVVTCAFCVVLSGLASAK